MILPSLWLRIIGTILCRKRTIPSQFTSIVVDEHVDPALFLKDRVHSGVDLFFVGNIGLEVSHSMYPFPGIAVRAIDRMTLS